jgi:outer membrane receptor protein involved in Fe transport
MSKQEKAAPAATTGINYTTTISAAVAAAVGGAVPVYAQDDVSGIEEITVTATKRGDVSIQDLAGSIQAFGTEQIRDQNLFNMEDYAKFTPSMVYFGNQAGSGQVYFRGIADAPDTFIAASSAAFYLDEQPVTQSSQVDVRLVDIERVEALSGPQGTLFGSSSQSGTLRIVTNKPDPTAFYANVDLSAKGMEGGDPSYDVSGVLNLPLAEDTFAVRLVGFSAVDGGYIDNVLGMTPRSEATGYTAYSGPQFNTDAVEENWNEARTIGGRVSAKWFMNDNWSATFGIAHQNTESSAENTYDPTVGDLEIIAFYADTFDDEWTQYALTLEGSLGDIDITSATAYFERESFYLQDTTSYAAYFGTFCYAPTATYNIYCFQPAGVNYIYNDPIGFLTNDQENTTFSQEFRISSTGERFNWVAGVYWEDRSEDWDFNSYTTNEGGYRNSQGWANWDTAYWNVSPPVTDAWWFSGDRTSWETMAAFGEMTFDITDQFSVTAGARWFDVEMEKTYWVELPGGRRTPSGQLLNGDATDKHGCLFDAAPCNPGDSDNPADTGFNQPNSSDQDTAIKLSAQFSFNDDVMAYALYSEGFRPGGVNRNRGAPKLPPQYGADFLTNYEVGLRSTWADGRLQANITAFFQEWDDYQLEVVDPSNIPCAVDPTPPCGQPWQKGVANVGNASSDGVEIQLEARPTDGLSIRANATFLDAQIDEEPPGLDDVFAGSKLPFAPDFKGSLYARYSWDSSVLPAGEQTYLQLAFTHVDDSLNQVQEISGGNAPQMVMEGYQTVGMKFGINGEDWELNFFGNNLFDERGQLYHDVTDFEPFWGRQRTAIIRPREFGIRFFKEWQ